MQEEDKTDCVVFIQRLAENARPYKTRETDVYEYRGLMHYVNPDDPVEFDPLSQIVDFVGPAQDGSYLTFRLNNTMPSDMLCSALTLQLKELKKSGIYKSIRRHPDRWKGYIRAYYLSESKDFTYEDIAKILHLPKSTVGDWVRQMRDFIKKGETHTTHYLPCGDCSYRGECPKEVYENCEKMEGWGPKFGKQLDVVLGKYKCLSDRENDSKEDLQENTLNRIFNEE